VENDTQRVPLPGTDRAHAVSHVHSIDAATALDRTVMNGEYDRIAQLQRHDFDARLHARSLFRQDELATVEVSLRLR
jgi:hypothetical protein